MILQANGNKQDKRCPQCKAEPDKRTLGSGFGPEIIICSKCGYQFKEHEL